MTPPKDLIDILKEENSFLILTHSTPDGDAFGSALALKLLLEQLNKKVEIYTEYPVPAQYRFLPGAEFIKNINFLSNEGFNVLVLVDCNHPSRVSYEKEVIEKVKNFTGKKIIIDHHIEDKSLDEFGFLKWIESEQAATGIMIYYLIRALNGDLTPAIAINLYTAVIVDTGNFQFDNTSQEVLYISAELVKAGAIPSYVYQQSFECWSESRFKLFTKMLNNVEIVYPMVIAYIKKEDFDETGATESDTERFVEFLRILKNVTIAVLFREIEKGFFKVSLRSKGNLDISIIAREFGGGGHKNASGYRITASFEEARQKLVEKLKIHNIL